MEGMIEMASALKKAISLKEREVRRELRELGDIHRKLLQDGGCACGGSGQCVVADTLERGTEMLSDSPMSSAMGNC